MKRRLKTRIMTVLLGAAVMAVFWAMQQTRAVAAAQADVQAARALRTQWEDRLTQLERAVVAPDSKQAEKVVTALSAAAGATAKDARVRRARGEKNPDAWAAVMNDPPLQNLYLAAERASLAGRYAPVCGAWNLTSVQTEKLEEIILRRNEQRMDLEDVMRASRLGERDPAITRLWDRANLAFRTEMIGLVGQQAYEDFQNYERALPVWDMVNRFAGAVALEGAPLSGDQASQLTETLAQSSPPYRAGGQADPNTIDWPVAVSQSVSILTPAQQTSFRNLAPTYPVPVERREDPSSWD